jgi:hypothetical protein
MRCDAIRSDPLRRWSLIIIKIYVPISALILGEILWSSTPPSPRAFGMAPTRSFFGIRRRELSFSVQVTDPTLFLGLNSETAFEHFTGANHDSQREYRGRERAIQRIHAGTGYYHQII